MVLAGCPLDEKISEMNLVETQGHTRRRARHCDRRQPDVRRHRTPHLQRLHEGLHLPEAGAGRYSAGRDPRAQGRAGAAVWLRNLFTADALEPAQHQAAAAEACDRTEGFGRRPRPGWLHARAPSDERRSHRRGDRRAQDRAARRRGFGRRTQRKARSVPSDPRQRRIERGSRRPRHGGFRRRRRIRHHGALGQELPEAHPAVAGAAERIQDVRRRAVRRHADDRQRVCARLRSHRAVRGRRAPHDRADEERARARHPAGVRFPHGAATHRRRQDRQRRQSAGAAAGRRHWRRAHGDRHRHRSARLLPPAGREIFEPLRSPRGRTWRSRRPLRLECAGGRGCGGVSRPCPQAPRRARRRGA